MSFDINQKKIELLRNDPKQFIISIQDLIDIIVNHFIRCREFNYSEKEDVKQQINE